MSLKKSPQAQSQAEESLQVFLVLREDIYETTFGDGYFAYFVNAFRTELEAASWVAGQPHEYAEPHTGFRYPILPGTLARDASGAWTLRCKLVAGEAAPVANVVQALGL